MLLALIKDVCQCSQLRSGYAHEHSNYMLPLPDAQGSTNLEIEALPAAYALIILSDTAASRLSGSCGLPFGQPARYAFRWLPSIQYEAKSHDVSSILHNKALVLSGPKLRRASLPSTAGLTWSTILPVDLRLDATAPVFCEVIIEFCFMESPHCSHHYSTTQKLALFAKEPDQHLSVSQSLAADRFSLWVS